VLKDKRFLYVLLPLNLLLWGYIGYKIYISLNDDNTFLPSEYPVSKADVKMVDSEKYTLSLDYEDPFLKEQPKHSKNRSGNTAVNITRPKPVNTNKSIQNIPVVKVNEIKYLGLIQNETSGLSTGLITVNGKSYIIKKGETVEGLVIKSIESENLLIKEGKTLLTIRKQ